MYLYSRTTENDFVDAFLRSELRHEQFSVPALRALYEHLSDLAEDIGEPIAFDMIAICCDWVEGSLSELKDMYPDLLLEAYAEDSCLKDMYPDLLLESRAHYLNFRFLDVLRERTEVIEVKHTNEPPTFLVQEF